MAAWRQIMGANSGRLFITPFNSLYAHIMGPPKPATGFNFTKWGRDLEGNKWNGTAPGPQIVGHVTFNGPVTDSVSDFRSIEVTPFITQPGSRVYTLMLVRPPDRHTYIYTLHVPDISGIVNITKRENGWPQLDPLDTNLWLIPAI